jgi:pimeloyl-ACP methyl ester carboxylesterase
MSAPVFESGRDLIIFDQRGIGVSRPALNCWEFNELLLEVMDSKLDELEINDEQAAEMALERLQACRDRLAIEADLAAYDSVNSAADVENIRTALDYDLINLWGGSYGTRLALEVMRRYPEGIRSVVLDAVYPPDVDLYQAAPANFQRALDRLYASCAANPVCNEVYPDLEQVLLSTAARLNQQPVTREIEAYGLDKTIQTRVNGNTLLAQVFQLLYDSRMRYFIPRIIYDVSNDDFDYMDKVLGSIISLIQISSRGMMLSVQCREELAFSDQEEYGKVLSAYPQLSGMFRDSIIGGLAYKACEIWDVGQAEESANKPVVSDLPALIMNGEYDPITPPEWGYRAAETLDNAYVYEYPGIGHGASLAHSCPESMFVAFLNNPYAAPDSSCINTMGGD